MNFQQYQDAAVRTLKCDMSELERLCNVVFGLVGEAGEIADYIKKVRFHGHDLDEEKLADELGDLLWYIAALCEEFDLDLYYVAQMNIDKLWARYPNGFSLEDSKRGRE